MRLKANKIFQTKPKTDIWDYGFNKPINIVYDGEDFNKTLESIMSSLESMNHSERIMLRVISLNQIFKGIIAFSERGPKAVTNMNKKVFKSFQESTQKLYFDYKGAILDVSKKFDSIKKELKAKENYFIDLFERELEEEIAILESINLDILTKDVP